ncbi:hypothetical protein MIR68_008289 [Amoeboaphelidium protococcarum]|nr:hypothetical protein MIR68_008289 [Amoeboaphelidium protococcarum]
MSDYNDSASDNELSDAQAIEEYSLIANRKKKKSGGFQSMGLSHAIFQGIMKKGYKVPTPIQRKCIPVILGSSAEGKFGRDVVAMSRTGSGKSAAFVIPMLEKLKSHSVKIGTRALILSPSRELSLQTASFTRDIAKFTDLRVVNIVGGDSLDDQFAMIATNPDVICATPGRLVHLMVEMSNVDFLSTVQYLVFDEADRLFEQGFEDQMREIMHKLSPNRQTCLFSATLPKSLVEFAKAGLQSPVLIRLDSESKISPDLDMMFFGVKQANKEAALLYLVKHVINTDNEQTIIFASTKHHVEYLRELLQSFLQLQSSYVYGSMDQVARSINISKFRSGQTRFLIVTDLAARGIDIPFLNNVVHYDFCDKPKLFIHRSGRVARAGRSGRSFALITNDDLAHLIDLKLFLGKTWRLGSDIADNVESKMVDYRNEVIYASFPQLLMQELMESVDSALITQDQLSALKKSSQNGYKLYKNTRSQASKESHIQARQIMEYAPLDSVKCGVHPFLRQYMNANQLQSVNLMEQLRNFRPQETIFEIRKMGLNKHHKEPDNAADMMKNRRALLSPAIAKKREKIQNNAQMSSSSKQNVVDNDRPSGDNSQLDDVELSQVFDMTSGQQSRKRKAAPEDFKDQEYYIPYARQDASDERGYAVNDLNSPFNKMASTAALDIVADDESGLKSQGHKSKLVWDKKQKKFVKQGQIGSDNKKYMKSESGALIRASYKTKAFEQWQNKNKVSFSGKEDSQFIEQLTHNGRVMRNGKGGRFRHNKQTAPKPLDPKSVDYERKLKKLKSQGKQPRTIKDELKSKDAIVRERKLKEKRREKNARPSKQSKQGGKRRR